MYHSLDLTLRRLLLDGITDLTTEDQIGFQPPNEDWRNVVASVPGTYVNVYLADLRENRTLRSNERVRTFTNGVVDEQMAPPRIDCHYLITAWSSAAAILEPTLDEHQVLSDVTRVLLSQGVLVPEQVFAPDAVPFIDIPEDCELPLSVLPVEGFPKYAEFWGTMGVNHLWKPAVYLVVTVPVIQPAIPAGPMVTTRLATFLQHGTTDLGERGIHIGGHVLDANGEAVAGAWVRLDSSEGVPLHITETNAQGRFTFNRLQAGSYQLNWRAVGHPEPAEPRAIDVPSPSGEYDLQFV